VVKDAVQLAVLWTIALGFVAAVPLTAVLGYSIVRSSQPAEERRARELRRLLLEEELYGGERCVECRTPVEHDWLRCPVCAAHLRERCDECGGMLKLHWSACPTCAAELVQPEHAAAA
jgi:hypothetical protein